MLIRAARLVRLDAAPPTTEPLDVRLEQGRVVELGAALGRRPGEPVVDADGRWLMPGLWDAHVHLLQWARTRIGLDLAGAASPEEVTRRVVARLAERGAQERGTVLGQGYRSAVWPRAATVAELDAVSEGLPVALVSGDAHNGWLNTSAQDLLGLARTDAPLTERDWFDVMARLGELPGLAEQTDRAYRESVADAAMRGVVGVVDFEFGRDRLAWPDRVAGGITGLRVRASTYPDGLDDVVAAGLRTGQEIPGCRGVVRMGALKIITDGSLNTRTAHCCRPYRGTTEHHGAANYTAEELRELMSRAAANGIDVAAHAIGDAAVAAALDAFAETGATGSIEHAQLVRRQDVPRIAAIGLRASVQPAHLLDDRDVMDRLWPDDAERCFPFRSMLNAGVTLTLGSDAPVAPLDPWLAAAAAVHRSGDEREPWQQQEAITPREALLASTDGHGTVTVGGPADLVLLDRDPTADAASSAVAAAHLRSVTVEATLVGGSLTHSCV